MNEAEAGRCFPTARDSAVCMLVDVLQRHLGPFLEKKNNLPGMGKYCRSGNSGNGAFSPISASAPATCTRPRNPPFIPWKRRLRFTSGSFQQGSEAVVTWLPVVAVPTGAQTHLQLEAVDSHQHLSVPGGSTPWEFPKCSFAGRSLQPGREEEDAAPLCDKSRLGTAASWLLPMPSSRPG